MKLSRTNLQVLPGRRPLSRGATDRPARGLPVRNRTVPIVLALRDMARKPGLSFRKVRIAVWNELHFTKNLAKAKTPTSETALGGAC